MPRDGWKGWERSGGEIEVVQGSEGEGRAWNAGKVGREGGGKVVGADGGVVSEGMGRWSC